MKFRDGPARENPARGNPVRERLAGALLAVYRNGVSPTLHALAPGGCRFQPTCSEYAAIAVAEWGLARGGWMALRRLLRCQPLSEGGFDPVPAKHSGREGGSHGRNNRHGPAGK